MVSLPKRAGRYTTPPAHHDTEGLPAPIRPLTGPFYCTRCDHGVLLLPSGEWIHVFRDQNESCTGGVHRDCGCRRLAPTTIDPLTRSPFLGGTAHHNPRH